MVRNVVLLCLDTVRKDYYDEYSPRLRSRAETTLERCYAASGWSMPSHASIFTGELPYAHGIHPRDRFTFSVLDTGKTFLGRLPDHATVGISANTYASSSFDFYDLFDEFVDYSPSVLFQDGLKPQVLRVQTGNTGKERYRTFLKRALCHERPLKSLANGVWGTVPRKNGLSKSSLFPYSQHDGCEKISSTVLNRLDQIDEPYVLFVNAMDAHAPYEPLPLYDSSLHNVPSDWHSDYLDSAQRESLEPSTEDHDGVEYYRQLYRASIDYLDRTFASFVDELLTRDDGETTVLVFSDHGENLGYESDDHLVGHNSLSNAVLHTPGDIINPPPSFPETVENPVSHLQFGDLVEAIAHDDTFPDIECSQVPAEVPRAGGLHRSDEPKAPHLERFVRTIVTTDERAEWDSLGASRVFELEGGFPEQEHLILEGDCVPGEASEFFDMSIEAYLETLDDTLLQAQQIDAATEQRLEELGYL